MIAVDYPVSRTQTALKGAHGKPTASIRIWLYGVVALVVLMVLVGGATRLTDSGLSITEWAPISGVIPPLTVADWNAAFDLYKTTTEYQTINRGMDLEAFKVIYWWEWGHRFLGRLIGLYVAIPLVWFWMSGRLPAPMKPRLLLLFAMGGLQGFIGWWMVKSGLVNRVDVSQIRLAIHLTMACIIVAYAMWLARSLADHTAHPVYGFTGQVSLLIGLILLQIFIGGLVAGLDAGMAYNTWPRMDGALVPDGLFIANPWWSNLTDNALTVQFLHRVTAYVVIIAAIWHALSLSASVGGTSHSHRGAVIVVLVIGQALIGIVTLLLQVPFWWALVHQLGALIVLLFAVAHARALSMPRTLEA